MGFKYFLALFHKRQQKSNYYYNYNQDYEYAYPCSWRLYNLRLLAWFAYAAAVHLLLIVVFHAVFAT